MLCNIKTAKISFNLRFQWSGPSQSWRPEGRSRNKESEVAQSCLDSLRPHGLKPQAPLSMGFSRQEYWSRVPLPSPGDLEAEPVFCSAPSSPLHKLWLVASQGWVGGGPSGMVQIQSSISDLGTQGKSSNINYFLYGAFLQEPPSCISCQNDASYGPQPSLRPWHLAVPHSTPHLSRGSHRQLDPEPLSSSEHPPLYKRYAS